MNSKGMDKPNEVSLESPCLLCGYNGPGYWQAGTHSPRCPWRRVGGKAERAQEPPDTVRKAVAVPLDSMVRWVVLFRSRNKMGGYRQYIVRDKGDFAMFRTKKAARAYAFETLGYISRRDDLRREPHGWMTPKVVRVTVTANAGREAQTARAGKDA